MVARTSSSEADVLQMAESVATSQKTDWFRGLGLLQVTGRDAGSIELSVLGGLGGKFKQLVFTVSARADQGSTAVRTRIAFYRTSQNTIMGFIPAGPKSMNNWATYKLFVERLSATVQAADPSAVITVSDTADSDPIPSVRSARAGS